MGMKHPDTVEELLELVSRIRSLCKFTRIDLGIETLASIDWRYLIAPFAMSTVWHRQAWTSKQVLLMLKYCSSTLR